jgi:hypothetical protein
MLDRRCDRWRRRDGIDVNRRRRDHHPQHAPDGITVIAVIGVIGTIGAIDDVAIIRPMIISSVTVVAARISSVPASIWSIALGD